MKNYEERSFGVFLPFYAAEYQLKKKVTVILRLHILPKKDAGSFPSNMYM